MRRYVFHIFDVLANQSSHSKPNIVQRDCGEKRGTRSSFRITIGKRFVTFFRCTNLIIALMNIECGFSVDGCCRAKALFMEIPFYRQKKLNQELLNAFSPIRTRTRIQHFNTLYYRFMGIVFGILHHLSKRFTTRFPTTMPSFCGTQRYI